ncbi:MAG: T9SS type A sorting domain-containing protein [Bacteroidota bacterium]
MMKRKLELTIVFTLLFILSLSIPTLQARHVIGGYLSYECQGIWSGSVQLKLKFDVVRERSGGGAGFDQPVQLGIYQEDGNGAWQLYSRHDVSISAIEELPLNIDPYLYLPSLMDYELGRYEEEINLPLGQGPFLIAYQRCCRLDRTYENVQSSDSLGAAMTLLITNEGMQACNNSPEMSFDGNRLFFLDSLTERSFNAQDLDGDFLVMEFVAPKVAGGPAGQLGQGGSVNSCNGVIPDPGNCPPPFEDVIYNPDYSFDHPFGLNQAMIDPNSLTLSATPTKAGLYLIGIKMTEYRNGVVLGETYYDYVVEVAPELLVAIINAKCYHDLNKNGTREADEPDLYLPLVAVEEVLNTSRDFFAGTTIYVEEIGTYTLLPFLKPQWRINMPNDSLQVEVDQLKMTYEVEVPIVGVVEDALADAYITSEPLICNTEIRYTITVINYGIEPISGSSSFIVDSSMTINGANFVYTPGLNDQEIYWNFSYLSPGEEKVFLVDVQMPNEEFAAELLQVSSQMQIFPSTTPNPTPITFESQHTSVLLCSYDPNDKLAHPDNEDGWIAPEEQILYTIRFQNTGNFWAKDVVLTDTLDAHLDLESFEVLSASHYHRLSIEGRAIAFNFLDIYLPDSTTSPLESQGFVTFKIRPKSGLPHNTLIENKAFIYFDRNAPIITNTVARRIKIEETEELFFAIFPNPFGNEVFVQLEAPPTDELILEIYNAQGQSVGTQILIDARSPVAMDRVAAGLYYMRIKDRNGEVLASATTVKYQ